MYGNFYNQAGSDIENVTNAIKRATSVASGCREVEKFMSNFRELTLEFFKDVFPILLKIIFGFERSQVGVLSPTSAAGWFNIASSLGHNADAKALVSLLSPNSTLFKALIATDKTGARFIFPYDRLPDFVCKLLRTEEGRKLLCQKMPLYKNRIENHPAGSVKVQVRVNLFEYYMFWFAFYPTSEGVASSTTRRKTTSSDISSLQMRTPLYSQLGHWKAALPGLHSGTSTNVNPYQELLVLYLSHFLFPLASSPSPLSIGSLPSLSSKPSRGGLSQAPMYGNIQSPGERAYGHILLNALLDFWFIGNDPLPVPLTKNERQALLQILPSFSTFCPPKDELIESQITLVCSICVNLELTSLELSSPPKIQTSSSFLNRSDSLSPGHVPAPFGSLGASSPPVRKGFAWQSPISPGSTTPPTTRERTPSLSSYPFTPTIMLQRPLYRFLFRAFTSPVSDSTVGQISRIIDLWVSYLEPWKSVPEKTNTKRKVSDRTGITGGTGMRTGESGGLEEDDPLLSEKGGDHSGKYEDKWESYVLINYPFYTALVLHFLDFAVKSVELEPETILCAVHKILRVFQSSHQLVELLKNMELVEIHSLQEGLYHHHRGWMRRFYDWLPKVREELKEWEGLESITELPAGSMVTQQLTEPLFRFFNKDASGGGQRLQKILKQAELELCSIDILSKVQEGAQMVFEIQPVISGLPPPPSTIQGNSRRTGQGSSLPQEGMREEKKWISSFSKRLSPVFEMLGLTTKKETPLRTGRTVEGIETQANFLEKEEKGVVYPLQLGKHTWEDVKYKGDYMRRPIESKEIAILVRLLVRFSDRLNKVLGLDAEMGGGQSDLQNTLTDRVDERGSERAGECGGGEEDVSGLRRRGRSHEGDEADGRRSGMDKEDVVVDERNGESEGLLRRRLFIDSIREREWGILCRELLVTLKVTAFQVSRFLAAFLGKQGKLAIISLQKFARKRGWRFNLRFLAQVPVIVFSTTLIFIVYWVYVLFP